MGFNPHIKMTKEVTISDDNLEVTKLIWIFIRTQKYSTPLTHANVPENNST